VYFKQYTYIFFFKKSKNIGGIIEVKIFITSKKIMDKLNFIANRKEILDTLFSEIKKITGVEDIAYHEVEDGKIIPVYKTQTRKLSNETWKEKHLEYNVKVEETAVLQHVVNKGEFFVINNVKEDPMSAKEFFAFGIESILLFPIKSNNITVATIVLASINEIHNFTQDEIEKCKELVEEFEKNYKKIRPSIIL
jgi:hypothetical protein